MKYGVTQTGIRVLSDSRCVQGVSFRIAGDREPGIVQGVILRSTCNISNFSFQVGQGPRGMPRLYDLLMRHARRSLP